MSEELKHEGQEGRVEQTKEEILSILNEVLNKREVNLVVGESDKFVVFPLELDVDKGDLLIETEYGAQWVEINNIKKVELVGAVDQFVKVQMGELKGRADEAKLGKERNGEEIGELKEEIESKFEAPTKEEIFEVVGVSAEKCSIVKEEKDKKGIYYFEFTVEGEGGEVLGYEYHRRGEFDTHKSGPSPDGLHSGTSIHESIYDKDGDFVKFPEHIAEYNHDSGQWKRV